METEKAAYFAEIAKGYYKTGRFSDGSIELLINAGHYDIEPVTAWTKTVWNRIDAKRGLNVTQKKWHKLGKYKAMKNISDDSLENHDPLHK
ncbi:hypothetical protein [Lactiplantibacillus songbeiensis]|uniref:Uncharacterized protein n=1 Tax=Lactiplantibacillus songbeiensis TaxID=2559920 RepID=A0ABW4C190_9LACO|nr:hypothetical protein [Lactiplantibacillus songbeiensis]